MARNRKNRCLAVSAALAAIALIWSGGVEGISARTQYFGTDRMSFLSMPTPDGAMCELPPDPAVAAAMAIEAVSEALPPSVDALLSGGGNICELPANVVAAPRASFAAAGAAQAQRRPLPPSVNEKAAESIPKLIRARSAVINRPPVRYLKDPYAAFSSISVNPENDMVIMTDENLFRIVEYSRRDNTPAGAPLTEPRRVISGDQTRGEMMCGSYIDPKTLEVYVTNNDTQNWLPTFSREARGNAAPDRVLATPHRTWGITADEVRQELYLTVQGAGSVVVYKKGASDYDAPIRLLRGEATELADPHGIALDMTRDLMVIANHGHREHSLPQPANRTPMSWDEYAKVWSRSMEQETGLRGIPSLFADPGGRGNGGGGGGEGDDGGGGGGWFDFPSITIHARGASGNTPPLRVIKGARTQLNWPSHVALHEQRGEIFVANDADDSVLVFKITDSGDVAPTRVIKGARTRIKNPTGVYVDAVNNELWVASMGNYTAAVFPLTASGNVAPIRQIRGGPENGTALMIGNPGAVGYDSKREEILVPNCVAHPQVAAFARLANGNAPPTRRIYGQASKLSRTMHDVRHDPVRDELIVANPFAAAILIFRGGANGQEAPIRIIQGPKTQLSNPQRMDIHPTRRELFVPSGGGILVFDLDANGDVAPKRVIRGPDTQGPGGSVAVDPVHNLIAAPGRNRSILIFDLMANGNVKPLRVIRGPNTQIDRINQMAIYPEGRLVVVAMPGIQGLVEPPRVFIGAWSLDDEGDVAPKFAIGGERTTMRKSFSVALDPAHKDVIVSDMRLNGVMTFNVPEMFVPVPEPAAPR